MAHWVEVHNRSRGSGLIIRARWCASFLCRLRGLMFRRRLELGQGLLLVEADQGVAGAAIHMWFVFMSLGVVWIDDRMTVVDVRQARPWRVYAPRRAARFILEGQPGMLESIAVGDVLEFRNAPGD
jgi:uncharacterized protein